MTLRRVRVLAPSAKAMSAGSLRALRLAFLVAIAVYVLGVFEIFRLGTPHRVLIFLGACVAGFLFFPWLNSGLQRLYEPLRRNRQQELAEKVVRGETLRIRGTFGIFVPMMLCLGALTVVLPSGTLTTLSGRAWLAAGIGLLAVFWYWAVPRLRAPILELDRNGLRTPRLGRVAWSDLERAHLRVNGSVDHEFIASHALQLEFVADRHPRPAQGLHRWARHFFRGLRDREERIPLRNPSENALVIVNLAMFCIRNTPRYQERRQAHEGARPETLAPRVAARSGSVMQIARPRIQRVHMLPRQSPVPKWVIATVSFLLIVLLIMGTRVNFLASPDWIRVSLIVAALVAAWPCWMIMRAALFAPPELQLQSAPWARALVAWLLLPPVIYFGCWVIVACSIPDIITRVAGTSFTETHVLEKRYDYSRRRCDYQVRGGPFARQFVKNHYCPWISEYERLPAKGPMTLRGRATWFGKHVDWIEPAESTSPK